MPRHLYQARFEVDAAYGSAAAHERAHKRASTAANPMMAREVQGSSDDVAHKDCLVSEPLRCNRLESYDDGARGRRPGDRGLGAVMCL